jgi:pimeloyl-ACP methyl ester carboxylesterase
MTAPLAHLVVTAPATDDAAQPRHTAFILHGILGSARNWLSFARRFVTQVPDWRLVLVDLRNHGDSHGAPPPHTLAACADDLAALAAHLGVVPEAVIGHSFGGKVALAYAREHGAGLRQCWVLDAVPGAANPRDIDGDTHEVVDVVGALRGVALPIASRAALQETLRASGFSESFAGWMTTNLRALDGGGFTWRFSLDAADAMLASYFETDFWPFLNALPESLCVHVVRAARSDRWRSADLARFADAQSGGDVRLHVLEDAGHWLHVDNPDGLMRLLAGGLNGVEAPRRFTPGTPPVA